MSNVGIRCEAQAFAHVYDRAYAQCCHGSDRSRNPRRKCFARTLRLSICALIDAHSYGVISTHVIRIHRNAPNPYDATTFDTQNAKGRKHERGTAQARELVSGVQTPDEQVEVGS